MAYEPRILLIDLENTPLLGYAWGVYEQNIISTKEHSIILSYAHKWYPKGKIEVVALPDFKGYKQNKMDDYKLVQTLHALLNQADILVAQNGDAFDVKKMNSRFLVHRLGPVKPLKTVDTLKILRSKFGFPSNKLDDIAKQLHLGGKLSHHGKDTWFGCMAGDAEAWKEMKAYNKHDIVLLEKLYEAVRGWSSPRHHPNLNLYTDNARCPFCQGHLQKKGMDRTRAGVYQRFQCVDCGAYPHGRIEKLPPIEIIP